MSLSDSHKQEVRATESSPFQVGYDAGVLMGDEHFRMNGCMAQPYLIEERDLAHADYISRLPDSGLEQQNHYHEFMSGHVEGYEAVQRLLFHIADNPVLFTYARCGVVLVLSGSDYDEQGNPLGFQAEQLPIQYEGGARCAPDSFQIFASGENGRQVMHAARATYDSLQMVPMAEREGE